MAKSADYEEDQDEFADGNDGEDEASDGDYDEEVLQKEPRRNAVYNSAALQENLEEIRWPEGLDWTQTLCVEYAVEEEIDVEDDLTREMAFYTQALEGAREAFTLLLRAGTPFLRPTDYYAEMVKSDSHMLKVKDMLLSQQKQMEEAEERRKAREAKRFSKELHAQKLKQRAQEKKHNIESVKKWRKMRQDQGFDGAEDEFPVDFDDGHDGRDTGFKTKRRRDGHTEGKFKTFKGSGGKGTFGSPVGKDVGGKRRKFGRPGKGMKSFNSVGKGSRNPGLHKGKPNAGSGFRGPGPHQPSNVVPWDRSSGKGSSGKAGGKSYQKRQSRDAKYGFGGKKSLKKSNTAESSAGFFGSKRKKAKS